MGASINGNRARYIRRKMKQGKPVSADDKASLARYEAGLTRKRKPTVDTLPEPPPEPTTADDDDEPEVQPPPPSPTPNPEPPHRTAPPPQPRLPKIDPVKTKAGKSKDWRATYAAGPSDKMGREATCVFVAGTWCKILKRMNAAIVAAGSNPILSDDFIDSMVFPAAVLTADDLTPDVDLQPRHLVVGASATVSAQGLVVAIRKRKAAAGEPPIDIASDDATEADMQTAARKENRENPEPDISPAPRPPVPEPADPSALATLNEMGYL